jgi:hypothetical protein
MKRRLLNLLTGLSVLLCVAVAVLWVRTCRRHDVVQFPDRRHSLYTTPHAVWSETASRPYWAGISYASYEQPAHGYLGRFGPFLGYTVRPVVGGRTHAALGFVYSSHVEPPPTSCGFTSVGVPLWAPLVLFSLLPATRLWRRRKRPRSGTCPSCGYDLRATPDKCPECGHVPARTT